MPETENHTYAKLALLCEAARYLRESWDKVEYEEREKLWWAVHKASRDVWDILHPPRKVANMGKIQKAVDRIIGKEKL